MTTLHFLAAVCIAIGILAIIVFRLIPKAPKPPRDVRGGPRLR